MDYKYIEQLLERYWEARTTRAEEQILHAFFSQRELPAHLQPYRELFAYFDRQQQADILSDDFDQRLLGIVGRADEEKKPLVVPLRSNTWRRSLRPLFQAVASVAIVVLVGIAAGRSFSDNNAASAWDYNPASYNDTYTNPQQAYHVVADGLEMFQKTAAADTLGTASPNHETTRTKQP